MPISFCAIKRWLFVVLLGVVWLTSSAKAADRDRLISFLDVTGFDVALDSISLSAGSAPQMLGLEGNPYGAAWRQLADDVFDTGEMRNTALDMLEITMTDALLAHAMEFYASDLGQRLVEAENIAHMDGSVERDALERNLMLKMAEDDAERLELLGRLNHAIDPQNTGLKAVQEVQVRFLMAAAAAGVYDMNVGEDELRAIMAEGEADLQAVLEAGAIASSAATYRDFSNEEIRDYAEALEHPDMSRLYELMNGVQYEIMANRFEVLAHRMSGLQAAEEI